METIKVKKTGESKFGYYLMDEESKFTSTTEQVSKYLENRIPCEVEVEQTGEKGVVERVKILENTNTEQQTDEKVPVERPGEQSETSSIPNYYETQRELNASIVAQVILKAVADMVSNGKIEPGNFKSNANLLVDIYKETKKGLLK